MALFLYIIPLFCQLFHQRKYTQLLIALESKITIQQPLFCFILSFFVQCWEKRACLLKGQKYKIYYNSMSSTIGRPNQSKLNEKFCKVLANKSQLISAQTQLLFMFGRIYQKNTNKKQIIMRRGSDMKGSTEPDQIYQLIMSMRIGHLDPQTKQQIDAKFAKIEESYKFQEITSKFMPNRIFSHQFELCYILYNFNAQKQLYPGSFPVKYQIYLCLLCLWKRELLTIQIIQIIAKKIDYIINGLNYSIKCIQIRLNQHVKSKSQLQPIQEQQQACEISSVEINENVSSNDELEENVKNKMEAKLQDSKQTLVRKLKKTKIIKKDRSKDSKQASNISKQQQLQKELCINFCRYISYSLYYIAKKDSKDPTTASNRPDSQPKAN